MHSLPSFSQHASTLRLAALFLAVTFCIGSVHTAGAADALTTAASAVTSSSSTTTNTSIVSKIKSIFTKKTTTSSSSDTTTSTTVSDRLNRSILGLPVGLLRTTASTVSKSVSKAFTSHITKN